MKINLTIPKDVNDWIESQLKVWKLSPHKLASAVHDLSSHYIHNEGHLTPWDSISTGAAYFIYFFPLNLLRAQSLELEAHRWKFFEGLTEAVDFGAGLGSASLALHLAGHKLNYQFIEQSLIPKEWGHQSPLNFYKNVHWLEPMQQPLISEKTLGIFSYSLVELKEPPPWMFDCEALFILEPSTQTAGRRLLKLRSDLIAKGYHIWAPCLHELECPLLSHSKTDWCHHRVGFEAPPWFSEIEKHLSMKNKTITYSYLLARKQKPTRASSFTNAARLVGDPLFEKGKTRQMICRSTEREFIAVLDREQIELHLDRGEIIEIPDDTPKKSNELRFKKHPILF